MARWMFSFNIPMVLDNFFWLMFFIAGFIGIAVGIYAIKYVKQLEAHTPKDEAFEAREAERLAAKAAKKQKPAKATAE